MQFLPIFIHHSALEPERCPHCNKVIEPKEVGSFWWPLLYTTILAAIIIWLVLIVVMWISPYEGNPTLLEVIKGQIEWVKTKRVF